MNEAFDSKLSNSANHKDPKALMHARKQERKGRFTTVVDSALLLNEKPNNAESSSVSSVSNKRPSKSKFKKKTKNSDVENNDFWSTDSYKSSNDEQDSSTMNKYIKV